MVIKEGDVFEVDLGIEEYEVKIIDGTHVYVRTKLYASHYPDRWGIADHTYQLPEKVSRKLQDMGVMDKYKFIKLGRS